MYLCILKCIQKTKMVKIITKAFIVIGFLTLQSCSDNSADLNSQAKQVIYIEESFKPLFTTSLYTYEGQIHKYQLEAKYCTELEAIDALLKNKTKTIFISRDFTKDEKAKLKLSQVEVRSEKIADDAVALIVNPANKDTTMSVSQLKRILKGEVNKWPTSMKDIVVVFDNQNSANFRYMQNLTNKAAIPVNVFAVKSNEEVIKYIKDHPSALGVIGVNWISDEDDKAVLDFLNGIVVVSLSQEEKGECFKPYQSYIYDHSYPLTRELWSINKASRQGANSGFVNFLSGEKGQLIIQKSSLVPSNSPVRMIQISTEK